MGTRKQPLVVEESAPQQSQQEYLEIKVPKFFPKNVTSNTILVTLLIIAAFAIGTLYTKLQYLEKNQKSATTQNTSAFAPTQPVAPTDDPTPKNVSVDDDPVMGNKDAPLTLIEFSDFECPFCKSFYDTSLPQLKKDYIDTGKVKLVYRDLPLNFHENAHKEAQAAECAREQGGDETFFRYHDEIFKRTTSNGTGLALTELPVIATALNLDVNSFQNCLDTEKYKAEVDKDIADANAAGANATPTFFLGKSSSTGTYSGTPIVGAQPYAVFKQAIEMQLQK